MTLNSPGGSAGYDLPLKSLDFHVFQKHNNVWEKPISGHKVRHEMLYALVYNH